jgi:diaminopimelate decarboxylase
MIQERNQTWYIEDARAHDIADEYGTPTYIYSKRAIQENIRKVKLVFGDVPTQIGFACKANDNIHLMNLMVQEGCSLDVVGRCEYLLARHAGASPDQIVINGNAISLSDIAFFLREGIHSINIDSHEVYSHVMDMVDVIQPSIRPLFFLRVNPDVDPLVHPYVSTGLKKSKFGIPLAQAEEILDHDQLGIIGIHAHIGSNLQEVSPFVEALDKLSAFAQSHPKIRHLNMGGGWGIDYLHDGTAFSVEKYQKQILPKLSGFEPPVLLELGRFLIANAGILVSKCLYHKKGHSRHFLVCDTNMAHLIRPALYQSFHKIIPLIFHTDQREKTIYDVVGGLCESGDILAWDRELARVEPGELIAILDAGAYGFSMASNYNAALRPAEVLVDGSKFRCIRNRETIEDILRLMEV